MSVSRYAREAFWARHREGDVVYDPLWEPWCLSTEESTAAQRHHAVRSVAAHARSAADLVELLDMLGLSALDGSVSDPALEQPEPAVPSGPSPELLAELAALRRWLIHSG
jgi:hypothetical protein